MAAAVAVPWTTAVVIMAAHAGGTNLKVVEVRNKGDPKCCFQALQETILISTKN